MKRALILLISVGNILVGATKTWNGTTNTDWNTGTNWTGGVPTTNVDDIVIAVGSTNQPQFNSTASGDSFVANPGFVNNKAAGSLTILPTYSFNTGSLTVNAPFTFTIQNAASGSGFNTSLTVGASSIGSTLSYSFTNPGGAVNASLLNFNGAFSGAGSASIATAAGAQATVTIANGITATFSSINSVNSNDSFVLSNASSNITINPASDSSIAGVISGAGSLTFNAINKSLTLLNANTYTGNTSIPNGTIALSGSGAIASSNAVIIGGTGTFDISQITSSSTSIKTLSGGGAVQLGSKTLTVNQESNQTYAGLIQDGGNGGSLIKAGAATLTLASTITNTYSGSTTITAGTLALSGNSGITVSNAVSIAGTFDISQVTTSATIKTVSGTGTISLGSKTLTVNQGSNQTFSGVIQDGGIGGGAGGKFTKTGASTLTLSGVNTYTGATTITTGTIALSGSGSIAPSASVAIAGTLDISQITSATSINTISGAGTISLGSKALTVIQGTSQTFSGVIQDGGIGGGTGGSFTKAGAATLTLTAANTFSGGTTISAGTLALSGGGSLLSTGAVAVAGTFDISAITSSTTIGDLSGAGGVNLGAKALTAGTSTPSVTYSGAMIGVGGSFTKAGSGTMIFSGTSTYSGPTTVTAGTFTVTGSIANSQMTIQSGATLKGTGTLDSVTSLNGSTIAPGTSIGTLTVSSVTFNPSSTFQIEINPTTASRLNVTGAATLDGTVSVIVDSGSYPRSKQYLILEAGSITGSFSAVTSSNPSFTFTLSQVGNDIFLSYATSLPPSLDGNLTGNLKKIANFINTNGSTSMVMLLSGLSENELKKALSRLSPARNVYGTYISQQTALSLSKVLTVHIDNYRFAKERIEAATTTTDLIAMTCDEINEKLCPDTCYLENCCPPTRCNNYSFWMSGFGEYAHQQASNENPAFNYISESGLIGFDYRGIMKTLAGFAAGYAHTHFFEDDNAGNGNINYYFASIYANGTLGCFHVCDEIIDFYASTALWGLFNKTDQTRNVSFPGFPETAKAEVFAWQINPHLEIGCMIERCWSTIAPFTALDWPISWQRRYEEHGAFPFNAIQPAIRSSLVRSETGLKFSQEWELDFGIFSLKEKGSYIYEKPFGIGTVHTGFVGTPGSFTVTALNQTLHLGAVGLDFLFAVGNDCSLIIDLDFEGEFGPHYWSSDGMLTFTKIF